MFAKLLLLKVIQLLLTVFFTVHTHSEDEPFEFLPPEEEPKIEPALKEKAENAIKVVAKLSFTPTLDTHVSEKPKKVKKTFSCSCCPAREEKVRKKKKRPATKLSARLKQASSQGFQIMKNVLFPSIPAVFQDLWVYIEIAIAITAFVFGALDTFQSSSISAFSLVYFCLAVLSFTLVLTDGYLYFIELGSCARGYKVFRKWRNKKKGQGDMDDLEQKMDRKCCKLSEKWKQRFSTWFEVIRNTVTELLLYPLLVFDLLSFIVERGYNPSDTMQRADFGLFLMESFYLVLSVYLMRMVLVITSMISLIKLPADKNDDTTKPILIRFSVHMIGQIFVHLLVILVVAAKINNENPVISDSPNNNITNNGTNDMDDDDENINASYSLIIAIVTGGIVPLAGSAMFFVVNYYWMKQFSITFWVNMITLLQGESFAEAVFGGEGVSSKEKTREFVQQSQFSKVKKELKKYKSPNLFTKLSFPTQFPGLLVIGVLYNSLLFVFIVSLMITDLHGSVTLVVFSEDHLLSVLFSVTALGLLITNIHILLLINTFIIVVTVIFILCIIFLVLGIVLSVTLLFPAIGGVGFSLLLIDICSPLFTGRSRRRRSSEFSTPNELIAHEITDGIEEHDYKLIPQSETKL